MNERNKDQNEGSSFTTFVYADGSFSKGNRHFVQLSINESCSIVSNYLQPYGLYSPWNFPGQNTGVASLSLLQRVFSTQGLNPGIPHCRQILYQLSHKGSPRIMHWVAYPFSSGSSWVSCIAGGFFTNWANCVYKSIIRKEMFQNTVLQGCLPVDYAKNEIPMNLELMLILKMCWSGVSWWFNIAFRLQGEEVCRISRESALKRTVIKESQKCPK